MSRQIVRFMEWTARTVAIAALFVAFKPSQALAEVASTDGTSYKSDDMVAGVVGDIEVDSEDEDTPAPE